jgi:hypothetical protein
VTAPKTTAQDAPPPRRKGGLLSFGVDVRRLVGPLLGRNGFVHADILAHWDDILGSVLARGVYPHRLVFPKGQRENATLHVKAVSGAYAMEFSARYPEILEKINAYFGYRAVFDIRVTQGALPVAGRRRIPTGKPVPETVRTRVRQTVSTIEDDRLRDAAEELGCLLE